MGVGHGRFGGGTPGPQHRLIWENVDHVLFAFPEGIAEMADRSGLMLTVAGSAHPGWRVPDAGCSLGVLWASVRAWASAESEVLHP